ncbi:MULTISPECIES: hypothetical protein [Pseudomonas]|jgi:hypothetical protein|uniref:hypothetical protein n=1 Tax=Pseudomonas TaxID=286 RepID=UPI0024A5AC07|nr:MULTISPECIES: hypothetical protein [Pseudomonas]WRT84575.1 hypothetical protein VK748_09185 [Pseudomonas citronellolis]GLU36305.1 hypothetical protein Pssp01_03980 [Pseudomonas sp. NBRC 100443]
MTPNLFATPRASLQTIETPAVPAVYQPYLLVVALLTLGVCSLGASSLWSWHNGQTLAQLLRSTPFIASDWLGRLLFNAAIIVLFMQRERERLRIASFRPLAGIVLGFVALLTLCMWLLGELASPVLSDIQRWLVVQASLRFWLYFPFLIAGSMGVLVLMCLVPLWLALRLARPYCERLADARTVSLDSWHLALGVALGVGAILHVPVKLLVGVLIPDIVGRWAQPLGFGVCVLCCLVVLLAARSKLPPRVTNIPVGRVLCASMLILFTWLLYLFSAVIAGFLLLFSQSLAPVRASLGWPLLALFGAAVALLLLWWGAGSISRGYLAKRLEEATQPSPR